ncbi:hypothetical protein [Giesbergeria anulus]|uniref:Uncharacterized protein n=1 Tax=Giesbergeria anulus TaxID=180197 RepID=A0A1H9NN61_9BURK|nr:hypothetical protein [Giesbergeria anulus]SER37378.1 hypothetical protein SAMN02982919_02279 [Giesbergeria anulus]
MTATLASNEFALPAPYPPSIARAADRATDCRIPPINALKPYARLLLQALVRSIQTKDITNSVRISNECFAQTLHVSVNKICKIKKELESKEWIVRTQVQSRRLGMQVSDICLTPWALRTLGLVSGRVKDHPAMPIPSEDQIAIRAAVVQEPAPPQHIEIKTGGDQPAPATSDATVAATKSDPQAAYYANNQVPDDLMPLRHLGLRASAIRKLMGMASKAGLMLGHIVELAEDSIAKAKNPYAYTVKLLSSNIDWQGRLAAKRKREAQQQEDTAQEQQTEDDASTVRQALAKTGLLSSEKRLYVWQWDSSSAVLKRTNIENFVCDPLLAKWAVALDTHAIAQAIRDGSIFAVTKEQLEQWQTAPSDDASAEPLVFTTPPTPPASPTPASKAGVQPPMQPAKRTHPWHGTPVAADMDALFAAASASPERWLCNPAKKVWLFRADNDLIRMAKLQEVQSKEAHKVEWRAVPTADITKVAQLLQEGQLIPVDKVTVQSWEPSQPQRETAAPEIAGALPPPTRQSGWQGLGLDNGLGCFFPT